MKNILVVIDMQNDFINGSLGSSDAKAIVPEVIKEVRQAVANEDYIFFTRDTHGTDYLQTQEGIKLPVKHCIRGTSGWNIHPDIMHEIEKAQVGLIDMINKPTFGSYRLATQVKDLVLHNEIGNIRIVGLCTDICVVSNALLLKANLKDNEIIINSHACAGTSKENHEAALKVMACCQCTIE